MRKITYLAILIIASSCSNSRYLDYTQHVNTLVGTPWKGNGGTLPCVGTPFAMTNFVPASEVNSIGGTPYRYENESLTGFMATHQPAVWMGDYGFLTFWPSIGEIVLDADARRWQYSHDDELAKPHFYQVKMTKNNATTDVSFTASERCAFFSFKTNKPDSFHLVFEASRSHQYNHRIKNLFSQAYRNTIFCLSQDKFRGTVEFHPELNQLWISNPERHSFHLGPDLKNFRCYYIIEFQTNIKGFGTWNNGEVTPESKAVNEKWCGAFVHTADSVVNIKIASSFISFDQAMQNLEKEIPTWNFEQLMQRTKDKWNEKLGTIEIQGSETQKNIFYTAMYHTLLYPRIFSEYGRYYSAFDDTIHSGTSYNDYSLWDTYRAQHPLLLLTAPEHVNPMIQSLIQMYEEGGFLPKWPNPTYTSIMIGTHADAVIADAFVKGYRDYNVDKAYAAVRKNAFTPPFGDRGKEHYVMNPWKSQIPADLPPNAGNAWWDRGLYNGGYEARGGLTGYIELGYVPNDYTSESASRTMEFSYDDFCVAQMAKALGHEDDYQVLMHRSNNFKNLYNREYNMVMPKNADGSWVLPTEEDGLGAEKDGKGFTEGSPWTYMFNAIHNIEGMVEMMGGTDLFIQLLDSNFTGNHYRHNNEPGHHYTYLYNYVGQPWKTQEKVRQYTLSQYKDAPDGLDGNDDCGQMSAWYIFSSLGFYPACPGKTEYTIGSPLFEKAEIRLPNNKKFVISTINGGDEKPYIKSIKLNGKPFDSFIIHHNDIINGGEIVFEMSADSPVEK